MSLEKQVPSVIIRVVTYIDQCPEKSIVMKANPGVVDHLINDGSSTSPNKDALPETEDLTNFIQQAFKNGPLVKRSRQKGPQFHTSWRDASTTQCISATRRGHDVQITFRLKVTYEYCNPADQLHAAAQCLFYDNGMAYLPLPLARPGFWEQMGFTRNLGVNLLRAARVGEEVLMELKDMCLLQGVMKRAKDGAVISTAEQNKFNTGGANMMAKL